MPCRGMMAERNGTDPARRNAPYQCIAASYRVSDSSHLVAIRVRILLVDADHHGTIHMIPTFAHELFVLLDGHLRILQKHRLALPAHGSGIKVDCVHILERWDDVLGLHQHAIGDGTQSACAGATYERLLGDLLQAAIRDVEFDVIDGEEAFVLLHDGVLWLCQDVHQVLKIEPLGRDDDREAPDKLRDHSEVHEILGDDAVEVTALNLGILDFLLHLGTEADGGDVDSAVHDALQTSVGASADE
mmetsp:Transcript_1053/g.3071  ORF Transcript_1053/g.3071 Transcript_1053/m.3071 type:complete len:245 (+) Transcript_1053:248-982(+)